MKGIPVFLLFMCVLSASAQENKFKKTLNKLQAYLDSSAVRKVDTNYIEVPRMPWRIATSLPVQQTPTTLMPFAP